MGLRLLIAALMLAPLPVLAQERGHSALPQPAFVEIDEDTSSPFYDFDTGTIVAGEIEEDCSSLDDQHIEASLQLDRATEAQVGTGEEE